MLAHGALFLVALLLYLASHGGMAGDYVFIPGNDVVTSMADYGQVLFNRWHFTVAEEAWLVQAFFYLNIPSFACGTWTAVLLLDLIEDVNLAFPFGLSLYSYCFMAGLPLTFVQWYWIGRLVERLVTKKERLGEGK